MFAQELVTFASSLPSDKLLHARCFYRNNEHRRCLATLEQAQFLSAASISSIISHIKQDQDQAILHVHSSQQTVPSAGRHTSSFPTASSSSSATPQPHSLPADPHPQEALNLGLEAILLAAQCLVILEQFEDCILLLEPFVLVDDNDALHSRILGNARRLFSTKSLEINPLAGRAMIL